MGRRNYKNAFRYINWGMKPPTPLEPDTLRWGMTCVKCGYGPHLSKGKLPGYWLKPYWAYRYQQAKPLYHKIMCEGCTAFELSKFFNGRCYKLRSPEQEERCVKRAALRQAGPIKLR